MKAIEFVATVHDGVIKIPKKYWKELEHELRIIILVAENVPEARQKKRVRRQLKAMSVHTKGLILDRDQAHER